MERFSSAPDTHIYIRPFWRQKTRKFHANTKDSGRVLPDLPLCNLRTQQSGLYFIHMPDLLLQSTEIQVKESLRRSHWLFYKIATSRRLHGKSFLEHIKCVDIVSCWYRHSVKSCFLRSSQVN